MKTDLSRQFQSARKRCHHSKLHKLISPGAHKLLHRFLARKGIFSGRVRAGLFFGDEMEVVLPEVVSEVLYTYGLFDEDVTSMVLQTMESGDVVLDIGAHFGYFTLLSSHIVGNAGRVLSFEPTPSTFEVLGLNTAGRSNIEIFNLAAGDEDATMSMMDFGLMYCAWNTLASEARMPRLPHDGDTVRVAVDVVNLDLFLEARKVQPDFIKIDAENFEANVIEGLSDTLRNKPSKVLMETGSEGSLQAGEFLIDIGLRPHIADQSGTLRAWSGVLREANECFKDILFLP